MYIVYTLCVHTNRMYTARNQRERLMWKDYDRKCSRFMTESVERLMWKDYDRKCSRFMIESVEGGEAYVERLQQKNSSEVVQL